MKIELVYGNATSQTLKTIEVPNHCTVAQALSLAKFTFAKLETKVGIFGKIVSMDQTLHANDRIEIYQPLTIDPKQARKLRAKIKQPQK